MIALLVIGSIPWFDIIFYAPSKSTFLQQSSRSLGRCVDHTLDLHPLNMATSVKLK